MDITQHVCSRRKSAGLTEISGCEIPCCSHFLLTLFKNSKHLQIFLNLGWVYVPRNLS